MNESRPLERLAGRRGDKRASEPRAERLRTGVVLLLQVASARLGRTHAGSRSTRGWKSRTKLAIEVVATTVMSMTSRRCERAQDFDDDLFSDVA